MQCPTYELTLSTIVFLGIQMKIGAKLDMKLNHLCLQHVFFFLYYVACMTIGLFIQGMMFQTLAIMIIQYVINIM